MPVKEACVRRETDRAGGATLIDVFDLGPIRLNAFPKPDEEGPPAYPLTIAYSPESKLVQLRHSVDPDLMFRDYWYTSGMNESMRQHLCEVVNETFRHVSLKEGDTVVDIGCNDGTMLSYYPDHVRKVGFDPAKGMNPDIDEFYNTFFPQSKFDSSAWNGKAKVVNTIAMFYDIEDPVAFAKDVREILDDDGVWVIEMHYLHTMLEKNEVDAICHEHICYYGLESLMGVMQQADLRVDDISFNSTNGGSMLAFVKKSPLTPSGVMNPLIQETLRRERATPLLDKLLAFARRIDTNRKLLHNMLKKIKAEGKTVYGYGASTKGNTLLQFAHITPYLLPAIAERNPDKWGRHTVGTRIPIVSEEQMREDKPDYLLALPYHFIDTFREREPWAKWIVPVPTPMIVS